MPDNVDAKREKLQKQLEGISEKEKQLKAKLRALDAKEKEAARKKETRAKIILGGFVVSQIKKGNHEFIKIYQQAISQSNERDSITLSEYKNIILKFDEESI